MEISTIGIDLSKTTFHLIGLSARGEIVLRKKLSRKQLLTFTAARIPLLIGMEACAGAHYLARALRDQGHDARLMPAQYVKPYVKTNGVSFRKGRDLSAWLGLVPRQHSTGGKTRLLGISKLGNEYLRRMMLHGARSVVMQMERNPSALGEWLTGLSARRHRNVTVVALANKMARIAWTLLTKGGSYGTPAVT